MIFHYAGKYNGDENSLPYKEHNPNAIPFKEPKDMKKYWKLFILPRVLTSKRRVTISEYINKLRDVETIPQL